MATIDQILHDEVDDQEDSIERASLVVQSVRDKIKSSNVTAESFEDLLTAIALDVESGLTALTTEAVRKSVVHMKRKIDAD